MDDLNILTPEEVAQLKQLMQEKSLVPAELLKGTSFWSYRDKIKWSNLMNKATYRVLIIFIRKISQQSMPAFDEYLNWVQKPFAVQDRKTQIVRRFQKRYGTVPKQRYLLSFRSSMNLFIETHIAESTKQRLKLEKAKFRIEKKIDELSKDNQLAQVKSQG